MDESYQSLVGAYGHGLPDFTRTQTERFLFRFDKVSSLPEMLRQFRSVDPLCPPLYACLLNRWISVFGQSDFVLRALSALISTSALVVLMGLSWLLFGWRVALLSGLLQAVSPFDIHYAQEARMYSLVLLCSICSAGALIGILRSGLKTRKSFLWLPLYVVSTWALINSHYTALFLALAQGLSSCAYLLYRREFRLLLILLVCWILTAMLWIPWLPMFLQSAGSRKESFYVARANDLIWPFKALFVRVPLNWLYFLSGQRVYAYALGLYASSAIMLVSALYYTRRAEEKRFELAALWIWAVLPALGLWFVDVLENHKVVEVARYLIFTAPPIFILAAYGLSRLFHRRKYFWMLTVSHLLFAGLNLYFTHSYHQREAWKEMASKVEELIAPDQVLVVSQHYDIACLDRYLKEPRRQLGASPSMGAEYLSRMLEGLNSFGLLTAQDGEAIKDLIPKEFKMKTQVDFSHGLHLRIYQK